MTNNTLSTNRYTPIIGLEVHVELKTQSKMFCTCSADYFGKAPNTHTCPVCLGLPGALPVPNKKAIEWCIKIALALNCQISTFSKFDRKNYFYPDLAKSFQLSQYDLPFGLNGSIQLSNERTIGITRVHMEEDTGKLSHETVNGEKVSLIDFNRGGVPLVEIVTDPDFHDALEVKEYLQKLQQIVRYLDVSNADMEKGDMRLEPNISLSLDPTILPKYKVEVKNINSFRFVEKAINYELKRHEEILERGEVPPQETRGWNEQKNATFSQRVKEEANDYRYFPEPDIPPIIFTDKEIDHIKSSLPELPDKKLERFMKDYELNEYSAEILTRELPVSQYIEDTIVIGKKENISAQQIANYIINKKPNLENVNGQSLISTIKAQSQVASIDESELEKIIDEVLMNNQKAVDDYKNGKETVIMFLMGQVMKNFKQKVDTKIILEKLREKLQ